MIRAIKSSLKKFQLNLENKVVLTEAATGPYAVTPVIAALSGARVFALSKESSYGTFDQIENDLRLLQSQLPPLNIKLVRSLAEIDEKIDIVTNSGFVRPIGKNIFDKMSEKSAIALMYEPWEFRGEDIDLDLAASKGIKVYGTNEHDPRLKTMDYIGLTALYLLLDQKITCFSGKRVLLVGSEKFVEPINRFLKLNFYDVEIISSYSKKCDPRDFDVIIVAENENPLSIIGDGDSSYINKDQISSSHLVIHICGQVDFDGAKFKYIPQKPKPFGYMSYRTDFVDVQALIDLQTGSLSVAQGMLEAHKLGLVGKDCKEFLEGNFPALAFDDEKHW